VVPTIGSVRVPPDDLSLGELTRALAKGWDLDVRDVACAPLGAGSHHWIVTGPDGGRHFMTDDLDTKPWIGDERGTVAAGLATAYTVAQALREAGLPFVVAPIPTRHRAPLQPAAEAWHDARRTGRPRRVPVPPTG
jgi:spectinomycin phosphotransferase